MSFSAGTFSINTTGQPVVAGTSITATVFNAFTADIATGLSTAMLKDGTQTATAGIGFYAGTVSLPGITFGTDTATGAYRIGLNNTGFAINGTKLLDLAATQMVVTGTIAAKDATAYSVGVTGAQLQLQGLDSGAANKNLVALRSFAQASQGGSFNTQVLVANSLTNITIHFASGLHLTSSGAAVRSTTDPTNSLNLYNGTAPVGTLTNGVSLYSVAGKLWAMDAAGAATQLTP